MAQAQLEMRQLGLGTLEEGSFSAVPYTQYWPEVYAPAAQDLTGRNKHTFLRQAGRLGDFVSHVTEDVVRGGDLSNLGDYPDFLRQRKPNLLAALTAWDESLGNFNAMQDGQGDLLRAAGLLLGNNVTPEMNKTGGVVSEPNPSTVYKAFASLWRNNPIECQQPSSQLLLAAQLVHKAAWVDTDSQRQDRLFGIADSMYSRICDAGINWYDGKVLAGELRADIRFHVWGNRLREGIAHGNTAQQQHAEKELRSLMQARAASFMRAHAHIAATSKESDNQSGVLFERFVSLAVRDRILSDWQRGKDSTGFEVRQSFAHEDTSSAHLKPNPSFDIVIQHHEPKGRIRTTPVQLKLRYSGSSEGGDDAYLPGIVYVRTHGLNMTQMNGAAMLLERKYSGPNRDNQDAAPSLLDVQRQLGHLLVAA